MYFSSLHGHGELSSPSSSGLPTVCTQGTNVPSSPSWSSACRPMRVMIRMETATYAESVSCTPISAIGEPSGPIENGTTYIVRPRMAPRNLSSSRARIFTGSSQLFVGPASSSRSEQMNVRSSTRATSSGSDRARYEFGRLASDRRSKVPLSTSAWHRSSYSSADPSHQWTRSGLHIAAISSTHAKSRSCLVGTVMSLATLVSAPESSKERSRVSPAPRVNPICPRARSMPRACWIEAPRQTPRRLLSHEPDAPPQPVRSRSAAASGGAARQLEPDAGRVVVAVDAPAVGHLVHEHEAEAAGLHRVRVRALLRYPARAAGVADLDVRAGVVGARAQADLLARVDAGVADAVGDELRDEQQERRLVLGRDEPAARHGMARFARRAPVRRDGQNEVRLCDCHVAPHE